MTWRCEWDAPCNVYWGSTMKLETVKLRLGWGKGEAGGSPVHQVWYRRSLRFGKKTGAKKREKSKKGDAEETAGDGCKKRICGDETLEHERGWN